MATRCTNAMARRRCLQLAPLVFEGLRVREIQQRAAQNPKLAWVATLNERTLHTYVGRINAMPIDSPGMRASVVAEVLQRLDETRRQLDALEAKLELVGIVDHE